MRHRETIAAPRADWTLLRMHYLRIVVPLAIVSFGTILILTAVVHSLMRMRGFGGDPGPGNGLDQLAIAFAGLIALPVGAAVFSRPFKEQHVLLFHALPISRLRQWALFATSSFLALLTVYAGIALLRPGAAQMLSRSRALPIFAIIVAITFTAGLCCSLVFLRLFAVYFGAYIAAILVPTLLCISLFAPAIAYEGIPRAMTAQDFIDGLVELPSELAPAVMFTGAALLVIALLAASAWFYMRGEMTLPRVQLQNVLILAGGAALLVLIAAPLMYAWPPGSRTVAESRISPDGRRVAVRHQNVRASWQNDLTVHDLAGSGSVTFDVPGLRDFRWLSGRELILWVRDMSPLRRLLYLRPARDRIERWSIDGRRIGAQVYDGQILRWSPAPARGSVVVRDGEVARVFEMRGGMKLRELVHAPVPDELWISPDLVNFSWYDKEPRMWRISDLGVQEIPRVRIASDKQRAWVFDGAFYPTPEPIVRKLEEHWPVPHGRNDRVGYRFGIDARRVYGIAADPSTRMATLSLFDVPSKTWKRIGEGIPLGEHEMPSEEPRFYNASTLASVFWSLSGHAFFAEQVDGRIRHRLYDPARGQTVTVLERPPEDTRRLTMNISFLDTPPNAVAVVLSQDLVTVAELLWRDGRLEPLPARPGDLRAVWPDGTQVRFNWVAFTVTDPRGNARSIPLARQ